jgi:Tetratricopeptide repeat
MPQGAREGDAAQAESDRAGDEPDEASAAPDRQRRAVAERSAGGERSEQETGIESGTELDADTSGAFDREDRFESRARGTVEPRDASERVVPTTGDAQDESTVRATRAPGAERDQLDDAASQRSRDEDEPSRGEPRARRPRSQPVVAPVEPRRMEGDAAAGSPGSSADGADADAELALGEAGADESSSLGGPADGVALGRVNLVRRGAGGGDDSEQEDPAEQDAASMLDAEPDFAAILAAGAAEELDAVPDQAAATPAEPDETLAESRPLPAAAAAAAAFSLATADERADGLEDESGPGGVSDFDTSDVTPLPGPQEFADERSNPRIKSSRGAEVAMVSGEVRESPRRPRAASGGVIAIGQRRRSASQSSSESGTGSGSESGTRSEHESGTGSEPGASSNGRWRSVELDQELSAAAEVVELVRPRFSAVVAPALAAAAELTAQRNARARQGGEETGDDPARAGFKRRTTRVSAMVRAAAGRALARTVSATVAAAVLVGACFGLLFWWLGARGDSAPATGPTAPIAARATDSGDAGRSAAVEPGAEPSPAKDPSVPRSQGGQPRVPIASGGGPSASSARPSAAPAPEPTYEELYEEAKRARRRRDHEGVLQLVNRALAERETAPALTLQAEAMVGLGNPRSALPIVERAIELKPGFSNAWYVKGRIHRILGERDSAREAFERYLEIDPEGSRADRVLDALQDM